MKKRKYKQRKLQFTIKRFLNLITWQSLLAANSMFTFHRRSSFSAVCYHTSYSWHMNCCCSGFSNPDKGGINWCNRFWMNP